MTDLGEEFMKPEWSARVAMLRYKAGLAREFAEEQLEKARKVRDNGYLQVADGMEDAAQYLLDQSTALAYEADLLEEGREKGS